MNIILSGLLVIVLFVTVAICDPENDEDIPVVEGHGGTITTAVEDDVLILTSENFDLNVAQDIILVEFYAPWCGHCKAMAPEYAKAAKLLKEESPPILLAKVDGTVESELAAKHDVSGFPTLYIFRKGQKYPYDGPRSAMGIVEYMKEQADPNWKPPKESVITLTKENFAETIQKSEIILVEFYAPWCGHCKQLAPEYDRAARSLKNLPKPIPLAKVDGIAEKELSNQYETRGWPTLMIFRHGRKFPYNGPRDEAGIISYMKEQAKPPSKEVSSGKILKNSVNPIDVTVVGFFESENGKLFQEYIAAANELREKFSFYHTFSESVAKEFGASRNRIILYQPDIYASEYEASHYEYIEVDGTAADITSFINEHCLPLVGERSQKTRWKYQNKYPLVVVYYDVDFSFEHRVRTQLVRKEISKVAKDFKGKITFAVSNEDDFEDELFDLGLDDSGEDVNVGYFESEKVRYRMEPVEDFSPDDLREFVTNVIAGKINRHIKSLPAPKENKGPVITVVGSTFEQLVSKSEKDVLLEFYAPWCGHCKQLEPIYKKLAKNFANSNNIMISKMDATSNDYPSDFDVKGFPTIYYIPSSDKNNMTTYEGGRTLKDLTDFINKQLDKNKVQKEEL